VVLNSAACVASAISFPIARSMVVLAYQIAGAMVMVLVASGDAAGWRWAAGQLAPQTYSAMSRNHLVPLFIVR